MVKTKLPLVENVSKVLLRREISSVQTAFDWIGNENTNGRVYKLHLIFQKFSLRLIDLHDDEIYSPSKDVPKPNAKYASIT